jgi:hypothetical protein
MPMVRHLPITKARINLGSVVKQVHLNKEYVVLKNTATQLALLLSSLLLPPDELPRG